MNAWKPASVHVQVIGIKGINARDSFLSSSPVSIVNVKMNEQENNDLLLQTGLCTGGGEQLPLRGLPPAWALQLWRHSQQWPS